jgi:hypothetical protein
MACGAAGHGAVRLHELAMPSSIEPMTAALRGPRKIAAGSSAKLTF